MKKIREMLPYIITIILTFYLLPNLIVDTGTAVIMLLVVMPVICFFSAVVYGAKKPFSFLYAIVVMLLFIPSIIIYYNWSAWIYILCFGIISLFGNAVGMILAKYRR